MKNTKDLLFLYLIINFIIFYFFFLIILKKLIQHDFYSLVTQIANSIDYKFPLNEV
jgi:hypothetical protein